MIDVIYEDNHLLVVNKPENMPICLDESKDLDLLTSCKKYLIEKYNKEGDAYLGLVHRLDRPVGGIVVFAKTSKAASRLSKQIQENKFQKTYLAVVNDNGLIESDTLIDKLEKDHKTNMVKVTSNGKLSELSYIVLKRKDNLALVKINLKTGRSHQIRVQFSSRNHALWGDQRYNKDARTGQQIALFASELRFEHPVTKQLLEFKQTIERYPFNI